MKPIFVKTAARGAFYALDVLFVLALLLLGPTACKNKFQSCAQFGVALCGHTSSSDVMHLPVTVCADVSDPSQITPENAAKDFKPPWYMDPAPEFADSMPILSGGLTIDPSYVVNPGLHTQAEDPAAGWFAAQGEGEAGLHTQIAGQSDLNGNVPFYIAAIQWDGTSKPTRKESTGIVINSRVILTAAHNLIDVDAKEDAATDLSERVYTVYINDGREGSGSGWGILHPLFNAKNRAYDLALVVLQQALTLDPARIPTFAFPNDDGQEGAACPINQDTAIIYGDGYGAGPRSDIPFPPPTYVPTKVSNGVGLPPSSLSWSYGLRMTTGQVIRRDSNPDSDSNADGKSPGRIPTPSIEVYNVQTMRGDAGAGMFFTGTDGQLHLAGILSGASSFYTRWGTRLTASIISWIADTVCQDPVPGQVVAAAMAPPYGWNGNKTYPSDQGYTWHMCCPNWLPNIENGPALPPQFVERGDLASEEPIASEGVTHPHPGGGCGGVNYLWGQDLNTNMKDLNLKVDNFLEQEQPIESAPKEKSALLWPNVVFLGDSFTDQHNGLMNPASGNTPAAGRGFYFGRFTNGFNWVDYFSKNLLGIQTNLAIGGATVTRAPNQATQWDLMKELRTGSYGGRELPNDLSRSAAFIVAGLNDILGPMRTSGHRGKTPDGIAAEIGAGMAEVVDYLRSKAAADQGDGMVGPTIVIVIAGIPLPSQLPVGNASTWPAGSYCASNLHDCIQFGDSAANAANERLKAIANAYAPFTMYVPLDDLLRKAEQVHNVNLFEPTLACINQSPVVGSSDGPPWVDSPCVGKLFFDGVHPTSLGMCVMSSYITRYMITNLFQFQWAPQSAVSDMVDSCAQVRQTFPGAVQGTNGRPVIYYVPASRAVTPFDDVGSPEDGNVTNAVCMAACKTKPGWNFFSGLASPRPDWFDLNVTSVSSLPYPWQATGTTPTSGPVQISGGTNSRGDGIGACACAAPNYPDGVSHP